MAERGNKGLTDRQREPDRERERERERGGRERVSERQRRRREIGNDRRGKTVRERGKEMASKGLLRGFYGFILVLRFRRKFEDHILGC